MKLGKGLGAAAWAGLAGSCGLVAGGCGSGGGEAARSSASGSASGGSRALSQAPSASPAASGGSESGSGAGERSSTAARVKPPAGFGNAQGRVLWNEKGAAGIEVRLCQDISFINGCGGKTYSAKTDAQGNYTVDRVPPGEYGLAVRIYNTDAFLYPTSGLLAAAKYKVEAGQTLDIEATNLYKTDLRMVSPRIGETVRTGLPTLAWKPYPGAASYEVTLDNAGGGQSQTIKSSEASATPESPLLNGSYTWKVTALNANGIKIARAGDAASFKVAGQAGSATVLLSAPKLDATVPGSGLTLRWQGHPLADGYQVYLNPASSAPGSGPILSFEPVQGTSYALSQPLAPGQYFWSVTATKGGKKIAASALQPFRVR